MEDGEHHLQSQFHLDPSIQLIKKKNELLAEGNVFKYKIIRKSNLQIKTKPCSSRYNELEMHQVLIYLDEFKDRTTQNTILVPNDVRITTQPILRDDGRANDSSIVNSWKFESNNQTYIVAILHKELYAGKRLMFAGKIPFHAQTVLINVNKNEIYRLKV